MIEGATMPGYLLSIALILSYPSNAVPSCHLPVILTCTVSLNSSRLDLSTM